MKKLVVLIAAALAIAGAGSLLLTSCSSGGGGSAPAYSKGVITAKGSIFVNEIEYSTMNSSITMEGTSNHADSELKVGMVVEVRGSRHDDGMTGEGAEIEFEDNLEGPLTAVAAGATSTLTALDQTIVVDGSTHFYPAGTTVSTLSSAVAVTPPLIEVSGLTDASGVIHATFVELKKTAPTSADPIELKGTIASGSTDTAAKTFRIGGLTVDYGSAVLSGMPGGIADGQFVEVGSTLGQYQPVTHRLVAAKVENRVEMAPGENDDSDVEGFVAGYNAGAKTFTVSGISVDASPAVLPPGLGNGSIVEVEGIYTGGKLVARKVVLRSSL